MIIAAAINDVEETELTAICDSFPLMLRRAQRDYPEAARIAEVQEIIDDETIPAIFIATPTHKHRELVIAALAAGKHVYCEAPLAHTMDDARAIAQAALDAPDQIFQGGLVYRTEPQYRSVFGFVRSGAIGKAIMSRSQWHTKQSWRRASSSQQRADELNWRLYQETSLGLVGEIGMHPVDIMSWMKGELPTAVSGFGNVLYWRDGRTEPDTIQAVFEYPGGENMLFDASLVSGFDSAYDLLFGSDSTINSSGSESMDVQRG